MTEDSHGARGRDEDDVNGLGGVQLDELADLQAGLLTAEEEQVLRRRIAGDPRAARLWEALEQTREELAGLPDLPLPDDVASRLDDAVAAELAARAAARPGEPGEGEAPRSDAPSAPGIGGAEPGGGAQVVDLAAARARRRVPRWAGIGVAACVAAVAVGVVATSVAGTRNPTPQPGSAPVTPSLTAGEVAGQWPGVASQHDLSYLDGAPDKLATCLGGAAVAAGDPVQVLGAQPVVVDGRYGVLVAVPGPVSATGADQVQLLVLGPQCSTTADHDVVASALVPR